jgi:LPS-assembly lipoprotein
MSSSERQEAGTGRIGRRGALAALAVGLLLGGCSIRPLYSNAPDEPALLDDLAAIEVKTPAERLAQLVRLEVEENLNPAGLAVPPRYELLMEVEDYNNSLAIQLDSTVTRYDLTLLASFSLREIGTVEPLYTSAARRVASYNVVRQPFATEMAERDAARRAASELGRDIRTQLALFFDGRAG